MPTILIVDDEPTISSALDHHFRYAGYATLLAENGSQAIALLEREPDLIVLDLMLPDIDGYEVCRRIRAGSRYIPLLMLTAKDELGDKVHGLDLGADAYLTKPFQVAELLAQVRALLRIVTREQSGKMQCGMVEINLVSHEVRVRGELISLTTTEYDLLLLLTNHQGQVIGREMLLRKIWGYSVSDEIVSRAVDTAIQRLRSKIEVDPKNPTMLLTVRGLGYRLICPQT